jgi:hypothetical protein
LLSRVRDSHRLTPPLRRLANTGCFIWKIRRPSTISWSLSPTFFYAPSRISSHRTLLPLLYYHSSHHRISRTPAIHPGIALTTRYPGSMTLIISPFDSVVQLANVVGGVAGFSKMPSPLHQTFFHLPPPRISPRPTILQSISLPRLSLHFIAHLFSLRCYHFATHHPLTVQLFYPSDLQVRNHNCSDALPQEASLLVLQRPRDTVNSTDLTTPRVSFHL